jgi:hypothetical protein
MFTLHLAERRLNTNPRTYRTVPETYMVIHADDTVDRCMFGAGVSGQSRIVTSVLKTQRPASCGK